PPGLRYLDVHVHLHPPGLAAAIERHFARDRWRNAHSFEPEAVAKTLASRGVERFCFFSYAHKPGLARGINQWVAETAQRLPGTIALGTLHPDDPDLLGVAEEARQLGLAGFKFHHSVQRFHVDDPRLVPLYERMEAEATILMLHIGTMPYRDAFTGVAAFERVMARFPRLRVCVAHLGAFDTDRFLALTARYPHLYLDTTMALTPLAAPYVGCDPAAVSDEALIRYQDRIMLGSDFPLIPYDYDEERSWAWQRGLPVEVQRKIFYDNAVRFLGLTGNGTGPG
ncbi:MAG: amidohydrolase family protein, partial [Candidatus Rokuibacteriota bacterium]